MIPTTTPAPPDAPLELGHPVRSFVLVLVALAVALLAVQWTGAINPAVHADGSGAADLGDGAQTFTVAVTNDSALPVEVVAVDWPTTGMIDQQIGIAPSTDSPDGGSVSYLLEPFEPFTLDQGDRAWLGIRVVPGCDATLGEPSVEVRTASGLHRQVDLDQPGEAVPGGCEAPP